MRLREASSAAIWAGLSLAAVLHVALLMSGRSPRRAPYGSAAPLSVLSEAVVELWEAEATPAPAPATASVLDGPVANAAHLTAKARSSPGPRSVGSAAHGVQGAPPSAAIPPEPEPRAPPPEARRRLSLAELGIGGSVPSAWLAQPRDELRPPADPGGTFRQGGGADVQQAEARLQASLRSGRGQRDQQHGLGPEGPLLEALTTLTYASASETDASATFRVSADERGQVTQVELLEASGSTREWENIRRKLLQQFAQRRLRVAGHGATLEVAVVSTETLPSGATPGLDVDLGGIPLQRGRGPSSSSLSILTPKVLAMPFGEDPDGVKVPVVSFGIAGSGDPTDLAAKARRVVRARLTRLDAH